MSEFDDNAPMTLREAAEGLLRGVVKASTLRAAADRGELEIERLGRVHVVTPRAIREWRERCRTPASERAAASPGAYAKTQIDRQRQAAAQAELKALAGIVDKLTKGKSRR